MGQESVIVSILPNKNTQEIQITLKIEIHYNISKENTMSTMVGSLCTHRWLKPIHTQQHRYFQQHTTEIWMERRSIYSIYNHKLHKRVSR